jgi:hypothetical protein
MKKKRFLLLCAGTMIFNLAIAQQGSPVTDQQPVVIEGLSCGYHIKSLETKTVGDKGNFSRYSISFFVQNVSGYPRVLPFRPGVNGMNGVADNLVQFNCLNATGARLTSKYAVIKAPPYNAYQNRGFVKMGYGIMPGQTISVDEVMIVPLNEQLNMMVFYIGYSQQLVPLYATYAPPPPVDPAPVPNQVAPVFDPQAFYQIKNMSNYTFINVQTGVISASPIQNGWFSAQWQIINIPGTLYVEFKNRWKSNFVSIQSGYIAMMPTDQSPGCEWILEPTDQNNVFRIKNVRTNLYLTISSNQLTTWAGIEGDHGKAWLIQ